MKTTDYFLWSDVVIAGFIIGVIVYIILGTVIQIVNYHSKKDLIVAPLTSSR